MNTGTIVVPMARCPSRINTTAAVGRRRSWCKVAAAAAAGTTASARSSLCSETRTSDDYYKLHISEPP